MKKIIITFLFLAIGPYLAWSNADEIARDFSMRGETLLYANIPTTDRECRSTLFLFHQCGFKYEDQGVSKRSDMQFFAFGAPDLVFLQRGAQSGGLTSTVAQEYFWNRIFTIVFTMFLSLMTLRAIISGATRSDADRIADTGAIQTVRETNYGAAPVGSVASANQTGKVVFGKRTS